MDISESDRLLAKSARQKMKTVPGHMEWDEEEFYAWMDTLPNDEAIAVFQELLEIQGKD